MRLNRYFDLQAMCLNVIVGHMDFYVNNNHLPDKAMAFFYRKYSDFLHTLLIERDIFCEKYMVWLLTPYWTNVTFCSSFVSDPKSILNKFKTYGKYVTSLNFNFCTIRPEMLNAVIFCVPHVTHLTLEGTDLPSHALACLRKMCPSLVMLNIAYCRNVDDDEILGLCRKNGDHDPFRLRHLNITHTQVSALGINDVLVELNHLEVLRHEALSTEFFMSHEEMPTRVAYKLTEFKHSASFDIKLRAILEAWTSFCPFIERVAICDSMDEEDFKQLSKFIHLKELVIRDNRRIDISHFNWFTATWSGNLTKLSLNNFKIDIVSLVSNCKNLECVHFKDVYFTKFEKEALKSNSELKCLKTLVFANAVFSDPVVLQAFQLLVSASNLEKLSIKYSAHVREKVASIILGSSSQLELLDLSFTDISTTLLLLFFDCPKLSKFFIDSCVQIQTDYHKLLQYTKTCEFGNTLSWHVDFWSNKDVGGCPIFGYLFE